MVAKCIILYPLDDKKLGSGHMRRSCKIAWELTQQNPVHSILITDKPSFWIKQIPTCAKLTAVSSIEKLPIEKNQEFFSPATTIVLLDRKQTNCNEIRQWSEIGTPILLDDDGASRALAPFLIDSIPGSRNSHANINSVAFLELPSRTRKPNPNGDILITFGGQDPAKLTNPVLHAILDAIHISPERITLTQKTAIADDVNILDAPENLKNHLHRFGLVFCSFGLTAFEALAAGCAVITVDPTAYHAKLSSSMGIPGIGYLSQGQKYLKRQQCRNLKTILSHPKELIDTCNRIFSDLQLDTPARKMSELLSEIPVPAPHCAACHASLPNVIARFSSRSYYYCRHCAIIGLYRFSQKKDEYGTAYFENEYRNQYGRTYLEDFPAIKSMGHTRLNIIAQLKSGGNLLDIGAAFGPFLQAASEKGYTVHGVDLSKKAVQYIREKLQYKAVCRDFLTLSPYDEFGINSFDVVTLWYVIEHFPNLKIVLKRLSNLVSPGGVLAFSTPNSRGISGKKSLKQFLDKSPHDHYTVWSPKSAHRLLKRHGFQIIRIRVTGHHPERLFPWVKRKSLLYKILMMLSYLFRLGDTFEIYAMRNTGD